VSRIVNNDDMLIRARQVQTVLLMMAFALELTLAGCGGDTPSPSAAPDDAAAACAALVRTKPGLVELGPDKLDDIERLRAAAWLGTVAAHEDDKKYGKLHLQMSAILQDTEKGNYAGLPTDARAALSVCSDLNLPH
ncbi:hypothetical protein, partial [Frankia sp. Cr1]|uniref:hypothetical protein n=1 Tax=Frankia sp. Cr1 TaxID=3073931 RepID=UPI002AD2EA80